MDSDLIFEIPSTGIEVHDDHFTLYGEQLPYGMIVCGAFHVKRLLGGHWLEWVEIELLLTERLAGILSTWA